MLIASEIVGIDRISGSGSISECGSSSRRHAAGSPRFQWWVVWDGMGAEKRKTRGGKMTEDRAQCTWRTRRRNKGRGDR